MEGNNWMRAQGEPSAADAAAGDWRSQLQHYERQRIVTQIMDTLKRQLPTSVPDGLNELQKIAVRFEEKIYATATSQFDYLRKISLKMLSVETTTQHTLAINPSMLNTTVPNQNPMDPASVDSTAQTGPAVVADWQEEIHQKAFRSPLMEGNNWMPTQREPPVTNATASNWHINLQSDARQRIITMIVDTLKRQLPTSVPNGLNELQKIAVRFEEKIYATATSQSDYLRKISLKMLSMETKTQHTLAINPSMLSTTVPNQNPMDPGW